MTLTTGPFTTASDHKKQYLLKQKQRKRYLKLIKLYDNLKILKKLIDVHFKVEFIEINKLILKKDLNI